MTRNGSRITRHSIAFILLWSCLLSVSPRAAGASATEWQTVYEGDQTSGSAFNDWIPIAGDWTLTPEGLKKSGKATDGLLMLRVPVVKGAVRVEYEEKADSQPDDLSLYLGIRDGDFGAAAFFGFGSKGNTTNTLRVPGMPESAGKGSLVTPGRWHKVTALREGGKLTLQAD